MLEYVTTTSSKSPTDQVMEFKKDNSMAKGMDRCGGLCGVVAGKAIAYCTGMALCLCAGWIPSYSSTNPAPC